MILQEVESLDILDIELTLDERYDLEDLVIDRIDSKAVAANVDKLLPNLSEREIEVASLLSNDYTQSEVAKELGISRGRVSQIVAEIRKKLADLEDLWQEPKQFEQSVV